MNKWPKVHVTQYPFPSKYPSFLILAPKILAISLATPGFSAIHTLKVFDAEEFIVQITQHIPPPRMRVIRYYGLYSSRSRQKWKEWDHVVRHAPDGWKNVHLENDAAEEEDITENETSATFSGKSTWARLIAKLYEVDPLVCTKCGGEMKVVAVIMDAVEVDKMLRHLVKTGKSPPGVCLDKLGMVS